MTSRIALQRALHLLTSGLASVTQRLPFLQHLAPLLSSPVSLRVATPLTLSFVGTHSLSGQTTAVVPFGPNENPTTAKIGEEFVWQFKTEDRTARSYTVTGDLSDLGVNYTFGIPVPGRPDLAGGTLRGTPTQTGPFFIDIIGWRQADETGERTPTYTLTIFVEDDRPPSPFRNWREIKWNSSDATNDEISGAQADPDGDGILNIMEYFLDLNPNTAGSIPGEIIIAPDDDTAYLYELPMREQATDVSFKFQRNPGLDPDGWSDVPMGPEVDSPYEVAVADGKVSLRFPRADSEFIRLVVSM